MYRLIVVDDEKAIRKGICEYIDWEKMCFEVVDSFEDGKETIEFLERNKVDVVLTDIKMAEVSGLELAKYIKEQGLKTKVVIISGYKDFEYARKALKYDVVHYLLKPIRLEEVTEVFHKIAKELDEEKEKERKRNLELEEFNALLPELREQFWITLLVGGLRSKELLIKKKNLLHLALELDKPCCILSIDWELEEHTEKFRKENFHNLIDNIFGGKVEDLISFPVFLAEDILKIIVVTTVNESIQLFEERIKSQIEEKCEIAKVLLKINFKVTIEKIFPDILCMTDYNSSIIENRESENNLEQQKILPEDYKRLTQKYKLLMTVINDGDFEILNDLIETIFYEFHKLPLEKVKKLVIDMFSMLSNKCMKIEIDLWRDIDETLHYQKILETKTLQQLKVQCKDMFHQAMKVVRNKQNANSRHFVDQALIYIKSNYHDDISLENIADKLFLNAAYFSRLFKQYMGMTFTDYLIELRMEKAKELLSLGKYKVYEVSKMVGYKSEKYFFRIFKQYTGYSPTEFYRHTNLNEEAKG
ncbi:hypothetical protein CS063_16235 [Sporanaerobium hydrogeniformans]|uniref:Uncharacterized protein n=1 Tax=Sporanaerobium hydrogeniformans TaxID=3072179 RepID=A0AC61D9D7_9FIRM|nr:response regulator [Sporanaerobium hydrogeniformans]PHV69338.1 hypothetical protein CS063_16235 [Sporanaerobium hydrogeniformans]